MVHAVNRGPFIQSHDQKAHAVTYAILDSNHNLVESYDNGPEAWTHLCALTAVEPDSYAMFGYDANGKLVSHSIIHDVSPSDPRVS
jgi:hypothetical protein